MGASSAGLRGLRGLPEATVTSYESRLKHLWETAEQLRPYGDLLQLFGGLAPPCVARPYMVMRAKLHEAAAGLLGAMKDRSTPEEWRKFELWSGGPGSLGTQSKVGPLADLRSLPLLTTYWKDAPEKWQGKTTIPIPGVGRLAGLGDADAESYALSLLDSSPVNPPPTTAMARESVGLAKRIWASRWFRALKPVGRVFGHAMNALFLGYVAWEGARAIYGWIWGEDPPPSVAEKVDAVIAEFNNGFLPEVSQQFQGMLIASASAKGNPSALHQAMLTIDPWALTPIPPMTGDDEGSYSSLIKLKRPTNPWLVGGVLLGGSGLTLALARDA